MDEGLVKPQGDNPEGHKVRLTVSGTRKYHCRLKEPVMKLASFRIKDNDTWGIIEDEKAYDIGDRLQARYAGLKALIAAHAYAEAQAAKSTAIPFPIEQIDWLARRAFAHWYSTRAAAFGIYPEQSPLTTKFSASSRILA